MQRVHATSMSAEGCGGVSVWFNSLAQGEDALRVQDDYGEGEPYPPMLILLPLIKGAVTGLWEEGSQADG